MSNSSLALVSTLSAALPLAPTPTDLQRVWRDNVLRWTIEHLIDTICFRSGQPGHEDCEAYWDSLDPVDRYDHFMCLGAAEQCGRCSFKWFGGIATPLILGPEIIEVTCPNCHADVIPVPTASPVAKSAAYCPSCGAAMIMRADQCPHCGNEHQPKTQQQQIWYEAVATTVADWLSHFRTWGGTIVMDQAYRLGKLIWQAKLVTIGSLSYYRDYRRAGTEVAAKMKELGYSGGYVSEAAAWAVLAPPVLALWQRYSQDPEGIEVDDEELVIPITYLPVTLPNGQVTTSLLDLPRSIQRRWIPWLRKQLHAGSWQYDDVLTGHIWDAGTAIIRPDIDANGLPMISVKSTEEDAETNAHDPEDNEDYRDEEGKMEYNVFQLCADDGAPRYLVIPWADDVFDWLLQKKGVRSGAYNCTELVEQVQVAAWL